MRRTGVGCAPLDMGKRGRDGGEEGARKERGKMGRKASGVDFSVAEQVISSVER